MWWAGLVLLAGCDGVFGLGRLPPPGADAAAADAADAASDARVSYSDVVFADGPLGYWRFGADSMATAIDATGNGANGTYAGTVSFGPGAIAADGPSDYAPIFDDATDFVAMGDRFGFEGVASFSVEAWVKYGGNTNNGGIVSKSYEMGGTMRWGWLLFMDEAFIGVERSTMPGTAQIAGSSVLPALAVWTHVAATYDGTRLILYVGGEPRGIAPQTPVISLPDYSTAFAIGGRNGGIDEQFVGSIDEVAVYDYPLSASQIVRHHQVGLGN